MYPATLEFEFLWTVTPTSDPEFDAYIASVRGVDAPSGSWRRVWYRATSWTKRDDSRDGLAGRSDASNAAWVVLLPPDGPGVSPIAIGSGPTPPDIVLQWTSTAPVKRTPLGPHVIAVRTGVAGSGGGRSGAATATPAFAASTATCHRRLRRGRCSLRRRCSPRRCSRACGAGDQVNAGGRRRGDVHPALLLPSIGSKVEPLTVNSRAVAPGPQASEPTIQQPQHRAGSRSKRPPHHLGLTRRILDLVLAAAA